MTLAALVLVAFGIAAAPAGGADADEAAAFLRTLEEGSLYPAEKVRLLEESWEAGSSEDPIGDALLFLDDAYAAADQSYAEGEVSKAQAAIEKVLEAARNPNVVAYAKLLQAKIRADGGDVEGALPLFQDLWDHSRDRMTADHEVRFYIAFSRAQLYERDAAIREFQAYLVEFPDAPERFLEAVRVVLRDLLLEGANPLLDVAGRMGEVKTLLRKEQTGDPTQTKQKDVVSILDELIALLEEMEKQGSGGGGAGSGKGRGGNPGGQRSSSPASKSAIPGGGDGDAKNLRRVSRGKPEESWGDLKGKEREEVLQAMKGKFPARYRALLEQYYRSLSNPGR